MADIQQILHDCSKDLVLFERVVSPQSFYLPTPEFHYEVTSLMTDRSIVQLLIEAPRGTAKSTHVKGAVLDHICFDEGDKVIIIQSKTRPEAINRLSAIKEVISYSQPFIELFGYHGEQASLLWREDKIKFRMRSPYTGEEFTVTIKALGTGQQVRGALENDTRITLYILDDPDDEDSCKTKEGMDANFDKFLGGLAGLDRRNGRCIVIGTPIRQGCIVERLREAPGWVTKQYKNTIDAEKKLVLWKEMYSYEWLQAKKLELEAVGKRSKYYSEYECEIMGDEDRFFKEEDFRYWDGNLEIIHGDTFLKITHKHNKELPVPELVPVNTYLGIDPASSTKQTADYSVTMVIAYDAEKNIYVLDYFRKRVQPLEHAEDIISKVKFYKPKRGQVETTGYQEFLRRYLRNRLKEEELYLPGLETKFNTRTEKSARLEDLQPLFAQHKIYLKPTMGDLIGELTFYPRSRNDDLCDALYFSIYKLTTPVHLYQEAEEPEDDLKVIMFRGKKEKPLGWMAA
jgi:predicted phage terminase large subunit-like protein